MSMRRHTLWHSFYILVLLAGGVGYTTWWWHQVHEYPAIDITGAYDVPDLAQPVFAQFVYSQKLVVPEPAKITRLRVPLFVPNDPEALRIDLIQNGRLLNRWRYRPTEENKVVFAELPLTPPRILSGELRVVFDGSAVPYADHGQAPRVFIDTSNMTYPAGNYRIAANEKQGNISLQVWGERKNSEQWLAEYARHPLQTLASASRWVLVGLVLASGPLWWRRRTADSAN